MKVVLTGGGTGGHVYPAISVGQALRKLDETVELLFIGSSYGPEGELVKSAGFNFMSVESAPLTKLISLKNISALSKLAKSVFKARNILNEFSPDIVLGTGGYTSAAVVIAQKFRGGKAIIHEQNAIPGRTNRWLSKIVDKVCISFDSSRSYFYEKKVVFTGMPIREEFSSLLDKTDARKKMGLNVDYFTVLVIGGSQGAKSLNELVLSAWPEIDDGNIQIIHQVGERNYKEMLEKLPNSIEDRYNIYSTVDTPLVVACADVVVCRSGASTLAEITAAGLPSLLVPYPYAYANHQKKNAEYIVNHNAGILCEEGLVTPHILADLIDIIRNHAEKRKSFEDASKSLAIIDASKKVAEVVMGLASD